jgi:hypothetical protein
MVETGKTNIGRFLSVSGSILRQILLSLPQRPGKASWVENISDKWYDDATAIKKPLGGENRWK